MANVKMGFGQISNPTPAGLNLWVRVFTVASGIFLLWMQTAPFISVHTQNNISSILGLLMALSNGLAPLFGIELPSNTKVSVEDVTAMDSTSKN